MTRESDDLADALCIKWFGDSDDKWPRDELRTLASEAYLAGIKQGEHQMAEHHKGVLEGEPAAPKDGRPHPNEPFDYTKPLFDPFNPADAYPRNGIPE